ncbi:hypothetical protein LPJ73_003354 [Coemansia sp. RSA 2703]|nr:hypothetical protein LPJ73_003359 [Coemansia sp. RSA 2703]KAJ2364076.1 hypothetical protein IW150_006575 [Coemansia sp. RSA 2607]KAJ2382645.1 hypothetical protein GGI05_005584 [Coemansia sp. RSA 2603]KAJ1850637.1 hypothetical protein LPJ73_003354 [Coemansia sp. RSA 2703]KAJ2377198.1 hypothetical protein IW150_001522 [Coemansia sp. RSA 2607]
MSFKFETDTTSSTSSVLPPSTVAGISDVLGQGPTKRVNDQLTSAHPLESRLANWETSQLNMKLSMQRSIYGLHAPMRTMMELHSVRQGVPQGMLGARASQIQMDILTGKDESFGVEDIFHNRDTAELPDVHRVLAGRGAF